VGLLLAAELALGAVVIRRVAYTEIDWAAYMQEVGGYLAGERDYRKIRGDTGPLVYPAGFLYLYSALRRLTNQGTDIRAAQHLFLVLYLLTQFVVLLLYQSRVASFRRSCELARDKPKATRLVWSWRLAMGLLCCSKRLHSIFLLRLFNDGPAMLLLYASVYLFTKQRWDVGCVVFSLAVSVKMNVLLFAPGLLLLLLQASPDWKGVVRRLGVGCALPQLVLGYPFLSTFPVSYLRKAFELDRIFFYQWTVNWKVMRHKVCRKNLRLPRIVLSDELNLPSMLLRLSSCQKKCSTQNSCLSCSWWHICLFWAFLLAPPFRPPKEGATGEIRCCSWDGRKL
jgi:alpha-1,3-mannosyltransferase